MDDKPTIYHTYRCSHVSFSHQASPTITYPYKTILDTYLFMLNISPPIKAWKYLWGISLSCPIIKYSNLISHPLDVFLSSQTFSTRTLANTHQPLKLGQHTLIWNVELKTEVKLLRLLDNLHVTVKLLVIFNLVLKPIWTCGLELSNSIDHSSSLASKLSYQIFFENNMPSLLCK